MIQTVARTQAAPRNFQVSGICAAKASRPRPRPISSNICSTQYTEVAVEMRGR
ncbi:hypothetical protein D9M69_580700 [compost metagenome]